MLYKWLKMVENILISQIPLNLCTKFKTLVAPSKLFSKLVRFCMMYLTTIINKMRDEEVKNLKSDFLWITLLHTEFYILDWPTFISIFQSRLTKNTLYSSLWDTLKMMPFTKYLIKWKRFGRISWKFRYWFYLISFYTIKYKKIYVILVQCALSLKMYTFAYMWGLQFSRYISFQ